MLNLPIERNLLMLIDELEVKDIVGVKVSRYLSWHKDEPKGLHKIVVRQAEEEVIKQVLDYTGFNQVQAAKVLGINRITLRRRMADYGLLKGSEESDVQQS